MKTSFNTKNIPLPIPLGTVYADIDTGRIYRLESADLDGLQWNRVLGTFYANELRTKFSKHILDFAHGLGCWGVISMDIQEDHITINHMGFSPDKYHLLYFPGIRSVKFHNWGFFTTVAITPNLFL